MIEENAPENEVIVLVVDEGGNTSVWVVLHVIGALLFLLLEVKEDCFVCKAKLFQDDGDLPDELNDAWSIYRAGAVMTWSAG